MTDLDALPRDPDLDYVPGDLQLLAGLNHGQVVVLDEDGVGPAVLVIAPGPFGHARRLQED